MTIRISKTVAFPDEFVTQASAILAKRRMGKSYLARRILEQAAAAGQQVCVVDPKGDWWGARLAADGKSPGLPLVIFGGEHGDVPIDAASGAVVARVVAEGGVNALIDLSLLRKHEVATFMAVFLEDLYRVKAREQYRTPLLVEVDEADAIAPQKPQPNEARMLGAMQDIVRRGGQRGIGCLMVTQRSAVLSKDVLTQVQILMTLRTIAPQDLAAVKAWIDVHGTVEEQKLLLSSLPSLPVGDVWTWSPGWPTDVGIFERSHVLPISTYDSGATPKPGQKRAEPKQLAAVDLEGVRARMAETLDRLEADDPRKLRARIAELEKQLGAKPAALKAERVEIEVFDEGRFGEVFEAISDQVEAVAAAAADAKTEIGKALVGYRNECRERHRHPPIAGRVKTGPKLADGETIIAHAPDVGRGMTSAGRCVDLPKRMPPVPGANLPKIERLILTALAQCHGRVPMTRERLALLIGYHQNAKGVANALGALRSRGAVEGLTITEGGFAELGEYEELPPTGTALIEWWCQHKLSPAEGRLLRTIATSRGKLSRDELAAKLDYHPNTKAFANGLGRLRGLGLVDGLMLNPAVFG